MLGAILLWVAGGLGLQQTVWAADAQESRGQEMLKRFAEANRYWLVAPPSSVSNFSYVLQRVGGTQEFDVSDPQAAPRSRRQGVTYSALVHQLARAPQRATVRELVEEPDRVRLTLNVEPPIRGACGNGVENSWNGYHSLGGSEGFLVLDTKRWVPLEAGVGRLRETFSEYVEVDAGHYAPLHIGMEVGDTHYDWRFRLHEPGLWLFDESHSGQRRLAWTEKVQVNSAPARLREASVVSLEREKRNEAGHDRLQTFLDANRHWLLPSPIPRRELAYDYTQEAPYRERVLFDNEGNLLVRLESSKDSPDQPSHLRLWLPDGRRVSGEWQDRFLKVEEADKNAPSYRESGLSLERHIQHLSMGLAIECAVTHVARDPENFRAELKLMPGRFDRYLLVLRPKRNARLFTGTMLMFTSWAYMHDVGYDRSEVLCDAATHRPLEEKDYAGTELKGQYTFAEWLDDPSGAAPGRIHAVVPHEKNGQDQSLEMDAHFRFARPAVWLLDRVESRFRNGAGESTGTVTLVSAAPETFAPIREALDRLQNSQATVAAIQEAPRGSAEIELKPGEWQRLPLQARWTDQARESAQWRDDDAKPQPARVIGLYRARLVPGADGAQRVELEGLSTAYWKEVNTEWNVRVVGAEAGSATTVSTNLIVRAEGTPGAFVVSLELPWRNGASSFDPRGLSVEGTVQRLTGFYHGHGRWFRMMQKD